ncbi:MAG: glycosyltransferase family 2 protein [Anaerolineales bacterium]
MKFSLVLATLNRTSELERFLASLDAQGYRDFELIIVDQNSDDRLLPILARYTALWPIIHLRSEKGLSRARNVGLSHVTGDVICFPDDDCWYPPDLLERVAVFFREHPECNGYCGKSTDEQGHDVAGRYDKQPGNISKYNVWRKAISFSIFVRRDLIHSVGFFDEALGVGAGTPYGSGEEMDYLIRAIENGHSLYYEPVLFVFHPNPTACYDDLAIRRALLYGGGMGRVWRKYHYPFWFVVYSLLRSFGGVLISLCMGNFSKLRFHQALLTGKIQGWIS